MANLEKERKAARLALRVEPSRKSAYEYAASINGKTVSQWMLANLDAAAERDVAAARTLRLPDEAFARICDMSDNPVPKELRELVDREPGQARTARGRNRLPSLPRIAKRVRREAAERRFAKVLL